MHQINIILINSQTNFRLLFKDKAKSRAIFNRIEAAMQSEKNELIAIEDEYGHRISLYANHVLGVLNTDTQDELESTIELKMMETRAQNTLQTRMASSPVLKLPMGGMQ